MSLVNIRIWLGQLLLSQNNSGSSTPRKLSGLFKWTFIKSGESKMPKMWIASCHRWHCWSGISKERKSNTNFLMGARDVTACQRWLGRLTNRESQALISQWQITSDTTTGQSWSGPRCRAFWWAPRRTLFSSPWNFVAWPANHHLLRRIILGTNGKWTSAYSACLR